MTTIHILEVNAIKKCKEIGNSQFGNGFVTELELLDTIKSTHRFGLVSKTNDVVSGFVLASVCETIDDLKNYYTENKTFKVTEDIASRVFCLPLYYDLSLGEVDLICRLIFRILNN